MVVFALEFSIITFPIKFRFVGVSFAGVTNKLKVSCDELTVSLTVNVILVEPY